VEPPPRLLVDPSELRRSRRAKQRRDRAPNLLGQRIVGRQQRQEVRDNTEVARRLDPRQTIPPQVAA